MKFRMQLTSCSMFGRLGRRATTAAWIDKHKGEFTELRLAQDVWRGNFEQRAQDFRRDDIRRRLLDMGIEQIRTLGFGFHENRAGLCLWVPPFAQLSLMVSLKADGDN